MIAPALRVQDDVARREPVGARLDHLADGHATNRRLEGERREVARRPGRAHLKPHPRVDRAPRVADEHLARPGLGHRYLDHAEILLLDGALRIAAELDLAAHPSVVSR
jgi:hypothetical protein